MASRRKKKDSLVAEDMLGWLDAAPSATKVTEKRVKPRNAAANVERSLNPQWLFKETAKTLLNIKQRDDSDFITSIVADDRNYAAQICRTDKNKPLRACHVELRFIGPLAQASAARKGRNLEQGAYLRFCTTKGQPGPMIPVSSGAQAAKISRQYCQCRKKQDAAACALKLNTKYNPSKRGLTLGGLRKPKN